MSKTGSSKTPCRSRQYNASLTGPLLRLLTSDCSDSSCRTCVAMPASTSNACWPPPSYASPSTAPRSRWRRWHLAPVSGSVRCTAASPVVARSWRRSIMTQWSRSRVRPPRLRRTPTRGKRWSAGARCTSTCSPPSGRCWRNWRRCSTRNPSLSRHNADAPGRPSPPSLNERRRRARHVRVSMQPTWWHCSTLP